MPDQDKVLAVEGLCPGPLGEEWPHEETRDLALALLRSLAATALAGGCGAPLVGTTEGAHSLDLSETQYTALQEVGGAVLVVVKDQRLIIARTAAATYTAYATCPGGG